MNEVILSLVLILICIGCTAINHKLNLPDDNLGEEIAEDIIKETTGLNIDLTPNSIEK